MLIVFLLNKVPRFFKLSGSTAETLPWSVGSTLPAEDVITASPLGLRDGAAIVYRDEREYQCYVAARGETAATSVGAGGGKKPKSGGAVPDAPSTRSASLSSAPKESGIKIRSRTAAKSSKAMSSSNASGTADAPAIPPSVAEDSSCTSSWNCVACTFLNSGSDDTCTICTTPRNE